MTERENKVPIADPVLLPGNNWVAAPERVGLNADGNELLTTMRPCISAIDVLVHEQVHHHEFRPMPFHEWTDEDGVREPIDEVVDCVRAIETRMNTKKRRNATTFCPHSCHPREVEELTMLMNDIGAEVVKGSVYEPLIPWRHRECDVKIRSEPIFWQGPGRNSGDPEIVSLLVRWTVTVTSSYHKDFMTRRRILGGEMISEMGTAARTRRKEIVYDSDLHESVSSRDANRG
jgi:hypothetical protein